MLKSIITGMILSTLGAVQKNDEPKAPFSLRLDQETYLSDKVGILNPNTIITLKPGMSIIVYLSDGTELKGLVKETSIENGTIFKVYGDIQNKNNTGFGFVLTKEGVFAGAVVMRDSQMTFTVKYSEAHNGHVLLLTEAPKKIS